MLVHTPGDPVRFAAIAQASATILEHGRLQAELQVQLAQVRQSRARLVTAGDAERRRIERDLHDGAQQRVVGLALHLQAARRRAPGHPVSVRVTVQVSNTEELVLLRISDDGPGGADPAGDGLRNLADRVAAHGGRLTVDSPAGAGTRLIAELPCGS